MNATALKFESNLLDLVTAVVMVPVAALYGLAWLIWQAVALLWPYRRYIALAVGVWAFVALCVACPMLPVGLGIVAAYAVATKPGVRS